MAETSAIGGFRCYQPTCDKPGNHTCSKCHQARYCSRDCQKLHWKAHKTICGKDVGSAVTTPQRFLAAMEGGQTGSWYAGLSQDRIVQRLIMSWQLYVDDVYVFQGELIGAYAAAGVGGSKAETMMQFKRYLRKAKQKGIMPPTWSKEDQKVLMGRATKMIHFALEKSDVIKEFGYSSNEHVVLRSMAAAIMGRGADEEGSDYSDDDDY